MIIKKKKKKHSCLNEKNRMNNCAIRKFGRVNNREKESVGWSCDMYITLYSECYFCIGNF